MISPMDSNSKEKDLSYKVALYDVEVKDLENVKIQLELREYSEHGFMPFYEIQTSGNKHSGFAPMKPTQQEALHLIESVVVKKLKELGLVGGTCQLTVISKV